MPSARGRDVHLLAHPAPRLWRHQQRGQRAQLWGRERHLVDGALLHRAGGAMLTAAQLAGLAPQALAALNTLAIAQPTPGRAVTRLVAQPLAHRSECRAVVFSPTHAPLSRPCPCGVGPPGTAAAARRRSAAGWPRRAARRRSWRRRPSRRWTHRYCAPAGGERRERGDAPAAMGGGEEGCSGRSAEGRRARRAISCWPSIEARVLRTCRQTGREW